MVASLKESVVVRQTREATSLTKPVSEFDFADFFLGNTRASGWFSDRFGTPRRHFCGEFFGDYEGDEFVLDERLYYTDGLIDEKLWRVSVDEAGNFTARSSSLLGDAIGVVSGNTLTMRYSMGVTIAEGKSWNLDMRDTMILQPDGSLHNVNHVYKWGIRIGTVSAQYVRQDVGGCQPDSALSSTRAARGLDIVTTRSNVTSIDR